jgi:hypothetical protein
MKAIRRILGGVLIVAEVILLPGCGTGGCVDTMHLQSVLERAVADNENAAASMRSNYGEPTADTAAKMSDALAAFTAVLPDVESDKRLKLAVEAVVVIYGHALSAAKDGGPVGYLGVTSQVELASQAMQIIRQRLSSSDVKHCSR